MNKNKVIRSQQLRFMVYTLIAFTMLFGIFGAIIFGQIKATLYAKTDSDLLASKRMLETGGAAVEGGNEPFPDKYGFIPRAKGRWPLTPRVIPLLWSDGKIVNAQQIGFIVYNHYFSDMTFNPSTIGVISNVTVQGKYHFRTVSIPYPEADGAYVQLLINVDSEQNLIDNFRRIIILCSAVFILLSISASYVLSRKMMKPIIRSWEKQVEFVENASHELRTPLTIIQNKLELLQTMPEKRIIDTFENIALSLSETRRLSRMTSDLLTLARADSTETQLEKQTIELDEFVDKVCSPYKEIAELSEKRMWLSLNSGIRLNADPGRLHQLLVILLDNALKYTGEHDSIGISTYVKENKTFIEVSDTGIGISEEGLSRIFDRFYREDRARSREQGGSGLGLSIAQWIVHSHHGTIQALHNEPKGVIFRIRLPKQ
ncbi:HAMP domain-containing sensor histidine kinase [Paenibacillus sp. VCA1]|uniref:sensor histidine kinase n=1 Tax=Paenibacillus sp. VCA1 TaxID=3039148 RepID=UPI002870E49F|nr:HAMP domain-containing sensor histidine kinase [Paenibacillus sp. VCA1]MDR9853547.1 HAMP domain-containing sensor histidine kinase [Paenibacillus sp. VCA1]